MWRNQENIDYTKSVTGVAYSKDDAKITVIGVEDKPGVAANIFEPLSNAQINVDMVIQNISSDQKTTDITFTVKRGREETRAGRATRGGAPRRARGNNSKMEANTKIRIFTYTVQYHYEYSTVSLTSV